jgi:DNA invertase Pin-like site-specific DNA recombinase
MIHGYVRASFFGPPLTAQLDALSFCDVMHQETASTPGETATLDRLAEQLQAGDVLVVTRLDRIGRSVVGLISFLQSLQERGVGLKVLEAGIDTTTEQGRLFWDVVTVFADLERDLIQEQTTSEMQAASMGVGGTKVGRPQVLTADKLNAARKLLDAGMSHTNVARSLGVSRSAVYRAFPQAGEAGQPELF